MRAIKKQRHLWLSCADEHALDTEIRIRWPKCMYLDDSVWTSPPVPKQSISDCLSQYVYFWPFGLDRNIPTIIDSHGRIIGPQSGVVVQYIRMRPCGNILESGTVSIGYLANDTIISGFVETLWQVLDDIAVAVDSINPVTGMIICRNYRGFAVGRSLASSCGLGINCHLLKYKGTENFYLPVASENISTQR